MTQRVRLDDLTSDQLDQLYDQLDALRQVARGYCPHCGRGDAAPSVADWEQQKQRADQLAGTLHDVLRHFVHKGHPGEPCLSSGWISEKTVARWRATLYPPAASTAAAADESARTTAINPTTSQEPT